VETNALILKLINRQQTDNNTPTNLPEDLTVTKEDLEAIGSLTRHPKEIDFENPTADINTRNIKDPLARVIEKRRLTFIKNWTIIWPTLQYRTNKPAISDKTWKLLAFGQYVDLADFLVQDISQATNDEGTLKTLEGGAISLVKEKRQKIFYLPQWIQAWSRYTKAALIICEARQEELAYHQESVINHCSAFPFDTVYSWDKAKRNNLIETREHTLLSPQYDIDARYLTHRANSRTQTPTTRNRGARYDKTEMCRLFNWIKRCDFGRLCNYKHACDTCSGDHPAKNCNESNNAAGKRRRTNHQSGPEGKRPRI
jgi:hypothetical protein